MAFSFLHQGEGKGPEDLGGEDNAYHPPQSALRDPPGRGGAGWRSSLGRGSPWLRGTSGRSWVAQVYRCRQPARCISAGRSPGPWRCRCGRPPAPRLSGRKVSAAPARASTPAEDRSLVGGLQAPGYRRHPVSGARPGAAAVWGWGEGRGRGESRRIRPETLGGFGNREPVLLGFRIRTGLLGFES